MRLVPTVCGDSACFYCGLRRRKTRADGLTSSGLLLSSMGFPCCLCLHLGMCIQHCWRHSAPVWFESNQNSFIFPHIVIAPVANNPVFCFVTLCPSPRQRSIILRFGLNDICHWFVTFTATFVNNKCQYIFTNIVNGKRVAHRAE